MNEIKCNSYKFNDAGFISAKNLQLNERNSKIEIRLSKHELTRIPQLKQTYNFTFCTIFLAMTKITSIHSSQEISTVHSSKQMNKINSDLANLINIKKSFASENLKKLKYPFPQQTIELHLISTVQGYHSMQPFIYMLNKKGDQKLKSISQLLDQLDCQNSFIKENYSPPSPGPKCTKHLLNNFRKQFDQKLQAFLENKKDVAIQYTRSHYNPINNNTVLDSFGMNYKFFDIIGLAESEAMDFFRNNGLCEYMTYDSYIKYYTLLFMIQLQIPTQNSIEVELLTIENWKIKAQVSIYKISANQIQEGYSESMIINEFHLEAEVESQLKMMRCKQETQQFF